MPICTTVLQYSAGDVISVAVKDLCSTGEKSREITALIDESALSFLIKINTYFQVPLYIFQTVFRFFRSRS